MESVIVGIVIGAVAFYLLFATGRTSGVMNGDVVLVLVSALCSRSSRRDLALREGVTSMENVLLSIGAILVMLYLIVALIRPERF